MLIHSPFSLRSCAAALVLLASCPAMFASSPVLMLDFGPIEATGDSKTNSPYHSVNESFTESHWNMIGLSGVDSGLIFADGQPAEGVSITLGASMESTRVDFTDAPASSSELGAATDITAEGSVFAGTSVGRDGIFTPSPNGNHLVGLKIGGLNPGRYEIYVVGINTSNGTRFQSPCAFYVAAMADVLSFETSDLEPSATSLLRSEGTKRWAEGASYARMTVELAAGEYLILVAGSLGPDHGGTERRGFLNAVQIVPVTEP